MNLRIITKNHTADSKIRSPPNIDFRPSGLTSSTRQLGSLTLYNFEFDEMRRELRNAPLRRSKLLSYIKLKNRLLAFENFFIESGTAGFFLRSGICVFVTFWIWIDPRLCFINIEHHVTHHLLLHNSTFQKWPEIFTPAPWNTGLCTPPLSTLQYTITTNLQILFKKFLGKIFKWGQLLSKSSNFLIF